MQGNNNREQLPQKMNMNNKKKISYYLYIKQIFEKEKTTPVLNDSKYYQHQHSNHPCFCCRNYILIHEVCQYSFIEKYNKDNMDSRKMDSYSTWRDSPPIATTLRPPSKYIKILYRLRPDLFKDLDRNQYKYIDRIVPSSSKMTDSNYMCIFENYFYQGHPPVGDNSDDSDHPPTEEITNTNDYVVCSVCSKEFCNMHFTMNEFYMEKCKSCTKHWAICPWCRYDYLHENFDIDNKISHEKELCICFHNKLHVKMKIQEDTLAISNHP